MGKVEEEQPLPPPVPPEPIAAARCPARNLVRFRCVSALVLGVAVLLSAISWLPPFLKGDPDSLYRNRAPVEASFMLQKPVPLLEENILQLEYDIDGEIGVPNSVVLVTSLQPFTRSNWTTVVFGVFPYTKMSTIPLTELSILRATFQSLVIQHPALRLTQSLFGDPFSFQVHKFPGGITVIPLQSGFLLQKVQVLFNFTLNFPIYQIQEIFSELKGQLVTGLHLTSDENLYLRLTNLHGSTIAPPVIVQSSVLFAVGNHVPSQPRLKQLAQAIQYGERNLGLNHTIFGKVKQVQLSSQLENSLNSSNSSPTPRPAPMPHVSHHHRHHHHHHYGPNDHLVPAPAPAPTPQHRDKASSRPGCRFRFSRKHFAHAHAPSEPIASPVVSPQPSYAHHLDGDAPAPSFPSPVHGHRSPSSTPLPPVLVGYARPPSRREEHSEPPDGELPVSPLPSSSCCEGLPSFRWCHWAYLLLICLAPHV